MGRLLPIVFLVLVTSCSETRETIENWIVRKEPEQLVPIHRLVEQGGVTFEVGSNLPFTGTSIEYRNGVVYKRQEYIRGKLSGESSRFRNNGELETQGRFKDGKPDGEWNYFFDYEIYSWGDDELVNLRLLEQGRFDGGEPVGLWKTGFRKVLNTEDGPKFEVEEVSLWGLTYFSSVGGDGLAEGRNTTGQVVQRGAFKDGEPKGVWEFFHQSGQLKERGAYRGGDKEGLRESFHENGIKSIKANYRGDKRDGFYEEYHENGSTSQSGNYIDGKQEGPWSYFYANGWLASKRTYKEGMPDGLSEFFHENGKLQSRRIYKDGKPDGFWELFDLAGAPIKSWDYSSSLTDSSKSREREFRRRLDSSKVED